MATSHNLHTSDQQLLDSYSLAVVDAVGVIAPAVVRVERLGARPSPQARVEPSGGTGSGFVFTPDGNVITNSHVVGDAKSLRIKLADGRDVESALKELCATFDGFYTLLVSNRDSFAVVRDAIACKPAVIAETDDWVAVGSEYRALAGLPGVENANIWEPEPEVIYAWTR